MSSQTQSSPSVLTLREKIAYGLGTTNDVWGNWLLPTMIWSLFGVYFKMGPDKIGLALLINRLVDVVTVPLFGWLSDNFRSRHGRRRPFILVGSILSGVTLPLFFWLLQPGWSEQAYFWYFVGGSSVYITVVSCFYTPYQSLGSEMTPDYNERTSLFSYKGAIQKIPEIATFGSAAFITMAWFNKADGTPDMLAGARVFSLILGVIMIGVGIYMFFTLKERYYEKVCASHQNRVGLGATLAAALRCRPFVAQLAIALAFGISTSMLGGIGYNLTVFHVCDGDATVGGQWNLWMGLAGTLLGMLGAISFGKFARSHGKRSSMFAVLISGIIVFLASWYFYNPAMPALQLLASGTIAFVTSGFWTMYGAIGADIVDCDELATGQRREGAFASCGSYLMMLGLALGSLFSGLVLKWTGFNPELGGNQADQTILYMRLAFAGIPVIGIAVALIALSFFGLSREETEQIRAELEARRGSVG